MSGLAERWPEEAHLSLRLATMNASVDRPDAAARYVRRAIDLAPDDFLVRLRAVDMLRDADPEEARDMLEQCRRRLKEDADLRVFQPDLDPMEALLVYDEDDPAPAIVLFEAAFKAEPDGVGIGADLALAYATVDRTSDALDVVAKALEHRRDDERLLKVQR